MLVSQTLDFGTRLKEEWRVRQKKNPSFSQRAFARSLNLDPSDLNKMMKGTRLPGRKVAGAIGHRLGWPVAETEICLRYHSDPTSDRSLFSEELSEALSSWKYFAILSLTATKGFEPSAAYIARKLSLPVAETESALLCLKRLGLLVVDVDGNWRDASAGTTISLGDPLKTTSARRTLQRSYAEQSLKAIDAVAIDRRNHISVTIPADPKRLAMARDMITVFRRDLTKFLSQGEGTEVYCLNIGLFPLPAEENQPTKR